MVYSKFPDIDIPHSTLQDVVFEKFQQYKDKTALVCYESGDSYTYCQLMDLSHRAAAGFARMGVRQGDVIALLCPNVPEFAFFLFGALKAGAIITTINPAYTVFEISRQIDDSGATFLCTLSSMAKHAMAACDKATTRVKDVIVTGRHEGCVSFSELIKDAEGLSHVTCDTKEDVALVLYSSGTTGLPKGVMLTHYNIVANLKQITVAPFMDPLVLPTDGGNQESVLLLLPLFHSFGLVCVLLAQLMRGNRLVTLQNFEPQLFLNAIQRYRISLLILVPPIVIFLAKSPLVANYDLSSVKSVLCGAAPLDKKTELQVKERLKIDSVVQGYGMTELSPVCTYPLPGAKAPRGNCGLVLPNTELQVVDVASGEVLGPKQQGEVWIRGPQVMKGYLNKPEATRKTIDPDGWLHSGDVGYFDQDGYFFIVDRIKELIKYKAYQIAPAELEAVLLTHPGVADAGVVGTPDYRAGEVPRAFIVRKAGHHSTTKQDIHLFVKSRLAPFKQLKGGVEFVREIPKSPSGKIMRRKLRDRYMESNSPSSKL